MNPQKENGFTAIANEIMEQIIKLPLSNYEFRILLTIFRKTYGYCKKEDFISLSQFSKLTFIPSSHCSRTLKKLVNRNIITITQTGKGIVKSISFQKDYSKWKLLPKQVLPIQVLPKQDKTITNPNDLLLPIQVSTKETITKETSTKEINIPFDVFWNLYDKKVGKINKLTIKWNKLTDTVRQKIINYIPQYKISQPNKKFRKNADTFFNNESWNDEIINDKIDNTDGTMTREGFRTNLPLSQRLRR